LPKNDRERIIPLSDWDIQVIRQHVDRYPPRPYTLPWEKPGGKPHTCKLLFRWPSDDEHVKARSYSETVWKPAAVKAGVIPAPEKVKRGRVRYATTRKDGIHQLRHYYASVTLAGGVSIKEMAGYLGHSDPAFTLRVHAHLLPSSRDRARAAIDERFTRMNADPASLTLNTATALTELGELRFSRSAKRNSTGGGYGAVEVGAGYHGHSPTRSSACSSGQTTNT
jgi:integrase